SSRAEGALGAARRAQVLNLEMGWLRLLGEELMMEQRDRGRGCGDTCTEEAERNKREQVLRECLWIGARLQADTNPDNAQRTIDKAIDVLQRDDAADYALLAYAWRHAMRIAWQAQSPEAAIAVGKQGLVAIERLRDLQPGLEGRAAAFSSWPQDYYWLSG